MEDLLFPLLLTKEEVDTANFLERNTGIDDQRRDKNQCLKLIKAFEDAHLLSKTDTYIKKLIEALKE